MTATSEVNPPITVVLADDHPLYSDGLIATINETPRLRLVGAAYDGQSALEMIREHEPQVAVIDIDMPRRSGLDVLKCVQEEGLRTDIIILTGSVEEHFVYGAYRQGAKGYIVKTARWPDIMDAILQVASGAVYMDPAISATLAEAVGGRGMVPLTERERSVLMLTVQGRGAREIGATLGLSDRAIKKNLSAIYRKLGVANKKEAIAEAVRLRVIG